jgi:hypothetical protein
MIMAHEKVKANITRQWSRAQAKGEPDSGITSVGGLAHRLGELLPGGGSAQAGEAEKLPAASTLPERRKHLIGNRPGERAVGGKP